MKRLGIRWTIGNVSERGFEALRLSVWGAYRVFGPHADYLICVNSIRADDVRANTTTLPPEVQWREVTMRDVPQIIKQHVDGHMAEGVAWKFAPLQLFPDRYELALDNDCILWALPPEIFTWLNDPAPCCLLAADVCACFGRFSTLCGDQPYNSGIRGLPPGFDFAVALETVFEVSPGVLKSELDEQGLQTAALGLERPPAVVPTHQVTICSPFWPHMEHLGICGAHFVGLNAKHLPWNYYGRPAIDHIAGHWDRLQPDLTRRIHPNLPMRV